MVNEFTDLEVAHLKEMDQPPMCLYLGVFYRITVFQLKNKNGD